MPFERRIAQVLHEEHQQTLALIAALEDLLGSGKHKSPNIKDAATRTTLEQTATAIEGEVRNHFAFEEAELFTRMSDMGDDELGRQLSAEHDVILPIGERVAALARAALAEGFSDQSWSKFFADTGEFIALLQPHVEKEEMALLPIVDEILDPETDSELCQRYGGNA